MKNSNSVKARLFKNYLTECDHNILLEMADDKKKYESFLANNARNLYNHLIYICVLGEKCPEIIPHWCGEIRNFTLPVVTNALKKGCENLDRSKSIQRLMMRPMMGENFEDYKIHEFEVALKNEKKKVDKKINDPRFSNNKVIYEKEISIINQLLPRLEEYVEKSKKRMMSFYEKFQQAANEEDEEILNDAINEIVNLNN